MIRFLVCLFLGLVCFAADSRSAVIPGEVSPADQPAVKNVLKLPVKKVEKLLGRKMTFKEKLAWKVSKLRATYFYKDGEPTPEQIKQGSLAVRLGGAGILIMILAMVGVPLGAFILLTLPLGIAALILGLKSTKGNGNLNGILGIVSGAAILFFWLLVALVVAVFLSSWGW